MLQGYTIFAMALVYIGVLFAIAWFGDRAAPRSWSRRGQPLIYALSIAVYCTTWTFMGSVGTAATTGWAFIPVYLGPILMFVFGWPLIQRIVRTAKAQNVTSIADFLAVRYGKSQTVAAVVASIAVVGAVPYIALQLKAILITVEALQSGGAATLAVDRFEIMSSEFQTGFLIAVLLATFAVLFGTRHIDATEHQFGLILAISAESVVKLIAFIVVGLYVVLYAFGGPGEFMARFNEHPQVQEIFAQSPDGAYWITVALLSSCCVLLLPRQFHVIVVENRAESDIRRAAWLFPLYLVGINLFVVPIAAAGLMLFPSHSDPDLFVINLPMAGHADLITALVFIGGLSAATAMVVVEAIAVSILISNGIVVPFMLRHGLIDSDSRDEIGGILLVIRRATIIGVVFLGFLFERALGTAAGLSAIGLVAFAAIAQLAPSFFIGLFWSGGTARGVIAGMVAGSAVWAYTLLLPWVIKAGWLPMSLLTEGPFGIAFLKPQALFYLSFEPLTHGVFWSLLANITMFLSVSQRARLPAPSRNATHSLTPGSGGSIRPASPLGGFRPEVADVSLGDLQGTVARYIGAERTERSFREFFASRGHPLSATERLDTQTLRFSEHLLTSAIGAASSRLVLSLLLRRQEFGSDTQLRLLDDASIALKQNRDLLQSAIDQVRHGLAVFDTNMQLICWNRRFRELLDLPPEFGRVGVPLSHILYTMAERGDFGQGDTDALVAKRLDQLAAGQDRFQERLASSGAHVEIRTAEMPQGGIVITFADITERVNVANELAEINLNLERRVEERTAELLSLNAALALAKTRADTANQDKTRFVAAATHDILQPLNAARLYSTSLLECELGGETSRIATNIDVSLRAVEEIFGAIMEISRIDAGREEPDVVAFPVDELLANLEVEYGAYARERNLRLRVVRSSLWIRSDKRMLRRILQNLLSNALKYTEHGSVLIGARRHGGDVHILIGDTGPGIAEEHQRVIFKEFRRINERAGDTRGLGLGLSIVERLSLLLNADVSLSSTVGRGSMFWVRAPRAESISLEKPRELQPTKPALDGTLVACIDNEPAILEGMRTLLGSWGCEVITGTDHASVIAQLRDCDDLPRVIFADYHLDDCTGQDAIFAIRKSVGAEIAGIIITADHSTERERQLRDLGLTLIRKPVKAAAVRAILNRYAAKPGVAAE